MGILIVTPVLLTLKHAVNNFKFPLKTPIISTFIAFFNRQNNPIPITNRRHTFSATENRYNLLFLIINYSEIALWLTFC